MGFGLWTSLALGLASVQAAPPVSEWIERADQSLYYESPNGWFRTDLSGLADLEGYYIDQPPGAILVSGDDFLLNPRLSLFLDTKLGDHFYSLVQFRVDRGFDPGVKDEGDARFDEYLLRYTPFEDGRVNLQIGKFATVVGNWVDRHDSWSNPFISAPLPYENILTITDHDAPGSRRAFLNRQNVPDNKPRWLPLLWGPSYATGASVFGLVDKFEYAFEVKNASISSRPYGWTIDRVDWDNPTYSGRLGYRPNATWRLGLSASQGTYLLPPTEKSGTLPPGKSIGDYDQITIGHDIAWSWRHWQVWAEIFASRFEVPRVGNADTLAYYIEAKYKLSPRCFAAVRWNQQFFDKVPDGLGGERRWDRDAWRIETALGYRFTRHLQAKVQYGLMHQNGPFTQGEQLVAGQLTLKF